MENLIKDLVDPQKEREARSFVGRKGVKYVEEFATKEEREHFDGILYNSGIPLFPFISYLTAKSVC